MFMEDYQISNTIRSAGVREFLYDVVSPIYSIRVREDQTHLLQ